MKKSLILLSTAAAITFFAPTLSNAQIAVEVPGVGVRIGEPNRDYDRSRYQERRGFREREVRSGQDCRTVTIQRDDGTVRRIRRCD